MTDEPTPIREWRIVSMWSTTKRAHIERVNGYIDSSRYPGRGKPVLTSEVVEVLPPSDGRTFRTRSGSTYHLVGGEPPQWSINAAR